MQLPDVNVPIYAHHEDGPEPERQTELASFSAPFARGALEAPAGAVKRQRRYDKERQ